MGNVSLTWDFSFGLLSTYIMVFCRMAGTLAFNPLFARRNIPNQVIIAICLGLSLAATPSLAARPGLSIPDNLLFAIMAELIIGLLWGVIFQFFYYMLFLAGTIIDTSLGLAMARMMDPATDIQSSISGNLFSLIFALYLFVTNSHLLLIRLAVSSYELVGPGGAYLSPELGAFLVSLFVQSFSLSIRLTLPFLAAAFTLELIMGVLMKLVQQIHIFSIHFQIKVIMSMLLLFAFAIPISNFLDNYMIIMFQQMEKALTFMIQ